MKGWGPQKVWVNEPRSKELQRKKKLLQLLSRCEKMSTRVNESTEGGGIEL